jgi:hypothetical protein
MKTFDIPYLYAVISNSVYDYHNRKPIFRNHPYQLVVFSNPGTREADFLCFYRIVNNAVPHCYLTLMGHKWVIIIPFTKEARDQWVELAK